MKTGLVALPFMATLAARPSFGGNGHGHGQSQGRGHANHGSLGCYGYGNHGQGQGQGQGHCEHGQGNGYGHESHGDDAFAPLNDGLDWDPVDLRQP